MRHQKHKKGGGFEFSKEDKDQMHSKQKGLYVLHFLFHKSIGTHTHTHTTGTQLKKKEIEEKSMDYNQQKQKTKTQRKTTNGVTKLP